MLGGFIISIYFNSLTIERSQGLSTECDTKKFLMRVIINTVLLVIFLGAMIFLGFIIVLIFKIKKIQDKNLDFVSIIFGIAFVSLITWIIYWRPLILSCCGLAIKKDFIQPNIGMKKAKESVVNFDEEEQVEN